MRTLCGTILAAAVCVVNGTFGANAFPAARGVLVRFAGESVAEKFAFERMEAAEPQAEVLAREGKILVRATDENRASAALGRYIREVAKGHWSRSTTIQRMLRLRRVSILKRRRNDRYCWNLRLSDLTLRMCSGRFFLIADVRLCRDSRTMPVHGRRSLG